MTVYVYARDSKAAYNIRWDFGDGTTSNDLVTSHTYAEPGIYRLILSASGLPFSDTEAVSLVVGDVQDNEPPVPALVCEETTMSPIDGIVTACDASGTLGPEGDYLTYSINWGDGTSSGVVSYNRFAHQY
ncbi:MAG TPA: PKD domain-containing protein [Cellvibrio sp.]|nr:PKD domain-containing protein [Cellvibrio sp.]